MDNQTIKKERKVIPLVILIIFIAQLALNGILLFDNYSKQKEIEKQQNILIPAQNISTSNEIEKDINDIKEDILQNKKEIKLNRISDILSLNAIVTDKLSIDMFITRTDELAYIGILPQPSYEQYFIGQGKIDLPDREIRGMIQEVISDAKVLYEKETRDLDYMPKFDDYIYTITHRGYEIAKYDNGAVKLLGE